MRQIDQPKRSALRIIEIYRRAVDDRSEVLASVDVQLRARLVEDGLLERCQGYPHYRPTPAGRVALGRAETVDRAVDVHVWINDNDGHVSFGRLLPDLRGVGPGEDAEGAWSVPVEWTIGPRANTRSFVRADQLRPAKKGNQR
jgi:hypothetical protein